MVYLTVRTGYTFFIEGIPMKKSDRKRRPAADKPVRDIYQEVPVPSDGRHGRFHGRVPLWFNGL